MPTSARCSSTRCGSRPTRCSARWGRAGAVAQTTLASERSAIAGGSGGADPPGLIALAQQRGLAGDPVVRQAVVEAHLRSELLRYLRLRSQTALSQGTRPGPRAR